MCGQGISIVRSFANRDERTNKYFRHRLDFTHCLLYYIIWYRKKSHFIQCFERRELHQHLQVGISKVFKKFKARVCDPYQKKRLC